MNQPIVARDDDDSGLFDGNATERSYKTLN